jgi:hypothetical protein
MAAVSRVPNQARAGWAVPTRSDPVDTWPLAGLADGWRRMTLCELRATSSAVIRSKNPSADDAPQAEGHP